MITLNGKKFARTEEEFTNSLFESDGTCVGYYRVNKKSISIQDKDHNKIGVIVNNDSPMLASATKRPNGRYWYSYGNPDLIGEYGSYVQYQEEVSGICKRYSI